MTTRNTNAATMIISAKLLPNHAAILQGMDAGDELRVELDGCELEYLGRAGADGIVIGKAPICDEE